MQTQRDTVARQSGAEALKHELVGLFQYIRRVRQEIAAIYRPADGDHQCDSMADQLDAIVGATEEATNTIMEAMENNDEILAGLREGITDADHLACLDRIGANGAAVFEACSFQDITGQRVSKVVKSVAYVEQRINALIEIWGKDEIEKVDVKPEREKTADEKLAHGPQLAGEGITQDEIDKLFD
ncbi:MAG: protein phosphatase CheZ [Alphaproteobacteria bacterium]|nr:protein phosphatase CheZ [Alphaproteobacteria bacterium]